MKDIYKLSHAQKRIFLEDQLNPNTSMWTIPFVATISKTINQELIKQSFDYVVSAHEAFRIKFSFIDNEICQYLDDTMKHDIEFLDFSNKNEKHFWKNWVKSESRKVMPILDSNLLEFKVASLGNGYSGFLLFLHHIIADGTTVALVFRQIIECYESLVQGDAMPSLENAGFLSSLSLESDYLKSEKYKDDERYWLEKFNDIPEALEFSYKPKTESTVTDRFKLSLSTELNKKLYNFCRKNHQSPLRVMIAAFSGLAFRLTGKERIVIGSGTACRPEGYENTAGMYVSSVPLLVDVKASSSFNDLVNDVADTLRAAVKHQQYPYDVLIAQLQKTQPVPDFMDVTMVGFLDILYSDDYDVKDSCNGSSNSALTCYVSYNKSGDESSHRVDININYKCDLFDQESIRRLTDQLKLFLESALNSPDKLVSELDIVSQEEQKQIITGFNTNFNNFPKDKNIHQIFEEQVNSTPSQRAVFTSEEKLKYYELNARANQLCRKLIKAGLNRGGVAGILVDQSPNMIVAVLAILKTGAAYMPIDSKYPQERVEFMLDDAKANVIVTQSHFLSQLNTSRTIVNLDDELLFSGDSSDVCIECSPDDLACLIYTSGSTGKPKGVMLEHKSIVNFSYWWINHAGITEKDHFSKHASFSFDASILEIYPSLFAGATLYIVPDQIRLSLHELNAFYEENNITIAFFTTQFAEQFMDLIDNHSLRFLAAGGEKLRTFKERDYQLVNIYGPTEATVCVTVFNVSKTYENIPIGKPVSNCNIYILDANNKPMPIGVSGELCIGGIPLARGYLNRPDLSVEKFINSPFHTDEKMYRTGDLARWLPDGNIEHMGRIDRQVKIRGFRIEPGEVELALLNIEGITESAVVPRKDAGGRLFLCGYFVGNKEIDSKTVKNNMEELLPPYMVPQYLVQLEEMPLTGSGKIDRKRLPAPEITKGEKIDYTPPQTDMQKVIIDIWQTVLDQEKIGIDDNFFALGGHSLKAVSIAVQIENATGKHFALKELLENPTVRQLSSCVDIMSEDKVEIIAAPDQEFYPVIPNQAQLYMLEKVGKIGTSYNIPIKLEFSKDLDKNCLGEAIDKIIARHDIFRTSFVMQDGELVQKIQKTVKSKNNFLEASISELPAISNDFIKPFDMSKAPLLRSLLVKTEDDQYTLFIDIHHIIFDGFSFNLFVSELMELYHNNAVSDIGLQFKDYAYWYKSQVSSEKIQTQGEYWKNTLESLPEIDLPTDFRRKSEPDFQGDNVSFVLDKYTAESLYIACSQTATTLHAFLMATVNTLLAKYTGQDDIVVGTPTAGRLHRESMDMLGMFVNTFPIRSFPVPEKSFRDLVTEVRRQMLNVAKNEEYPIDKIYEFAASRSEAGRNPLFDVIFVMENIEFPSFGQNQVIQGCDFVIGKTSKFDLNFIVEEIGEDLTFHIEYRKSLFQRSTIKRMAGHFRNVLDAVIKNQDLLISEINMLSRKEEYSLLHNYNDNTAKWPQEKTIHDLFEEQVYSTPLQIAVFTSEEKLSYYELNARANQLCRKLINAGLSRGGVAGILVDQSPNMIVAVLAILKTGAAYMPIDSKYPQERVEFMLEDAKAKVIVTQSHFLNQLNTSRTIVNLDDELLFSGDASDVRVTCSPDDLACLIYTSGSTGKPKGVMLEHKSIVNFSYWWIDHAGITEKDHFSKHASFSFDASILEIYPSLFAGATLYIVPDQIRLSLHELNAYYEENNITIAFFTTQFAEQFMNLIDNHSLRFLVAGGEKLRIFKERDYQLVNIYGPTEATVCVTAFNVSKTYENIPIGKPVSNCNIYILDANNKPMPIGVSGELCIGSVPLARGYLNRPELSDEKFTNSPFHTDEKMYRTGDLARWLPDGNIEHMGRIDRQVKIRGLRIEPGEVELAMLNIEGITESAVVPRKDAGGRLFLCGYFVGKREIDCKKMKNNMEELLPPYMVPQYLVQLEEMPLTGSGKIDRKLLPVPEITKGERIEYIPPQTDLQKVIIDIWQTALDQEKIGIDDNFFALGGHSLKAVSIAVQIENATGKHFALKELFENPTVRQLSSCIDSISEEKVEIIAAPDQDFYPVVPNQAQLYMLEQMGKIGTAYNIPIKFEFSKDLDTNRLGEAIDKIIARHDIFRTSFIMQDGELVQKIQKTVKMKRNFLEASIGDLPAISNEFVKPFDMGKAPLLRALLVKTEDDKYTLFIDIHHIIFDGFSFSIFVSELMELYHHNEVSDIGLQFKDYAYWYKSQVSNEKILTQGEYWKNTLKSLPVIDLPTDFRRLSEPDFEGDHVSFVLDKYTAESLYIACSQTATTLHAFLMAAVNTLLAKYTGQDDIVVGTPTAGRLHRESMEMLGMFVNTFPIRSFPLPEKSFRDLVTEVRRQMLNVAKNEEYPIDKIYEFAASRREAGRNPLFDVLFVMENIEFPSFGQDQVIQRCDFIIDKTSKFDLNFTVEETGEDLTFHIEYRKSLFQESTINRMVGHLRNILDAVSKNQDLLISEINMLSRKEEYSLLHKYNNTAAKWPREKTIQDLFEEKVDQFPENIAVEYGETRLTYLELDQKSNNLAAKLRNCGVESDRIVGIFLDRGVEMVIAALGILKAGGAYLPVIPDYPADRINYIFSDSGADIVVSTSELAKNLDFAGKVFDVNDSDTFEGPGDRLINKTRPSDMAYIIYTSGSTGKPKGVMVEHHNVIRLMRNDKFYFDFDENDTWSLFHSFSFDFSVWEMYGALLFGGRLIIVPKDAAQSPELFRDLLVEKKVTILNQTPGAFYNLIDEDTQHERQELAFRFVIFGGEALKPIMLKPFYKRYPDTKLINMYGITETTVHVTYKEITSKEIDFNISNIGLPIPTLSTYIFDEQKHLVPIGVAGELCVGGDGVTRGYLNKEELTAERFFDNPYIHGERIYKSGDLVKRRSDGEIEYLGRIDFQVQLHGFRVELGEIENELIKHEAVEKTVVLAKEDKNHVQFLCAYYLADKDITVNEFRSFLSESLPDYMIPSYFIHMASLPLTSNGKIDRRALPEPGSAVVTGTEYVAPEDKRQQLIIDIWNEVLEIDKIGIKDDFFALGGHSLKAVALTAKLQNHFKVSVNDIFSYPTVEKLAENITDIEGGIKSRLFKVRQSFDLVTNESDPELNANYLKYLEKCKVYDDLDAKEKTEFNKVFLTGSTGYLGVYLLRELLENGIKVVTIVRGDSDEHSAKRLREKYEFYFGKEKPNIIENVDVFCGDLQKDKLGLSLENYEKIAEETDCIIHSAAIVRHFGHYDEFYSANVQATINLLTLAETNKPKLFNHISTCSVAHGTIPDTDEIIFTEFDHDLGQKSDNIYVKTKLLAENEVLDFQKRGGKARIFRLGNIAFDSDTGYFQQNNEENAFFQQVKTYLNLGLVPEQSDDRDLSYVNQCADAIVSLCRCPSLDNETFHIENPYRVKLSEILIKSELELNIEKVPFHEFIDYLILKHDQVFFKEYVENIMLHMGWMEEESSKTACQFYMDKSVRVLEKLGFKWTNPDPKRFEIIISKALAARRKMLKEMNLISELPDELVEYLCKRSKLESFSDEQYLFWEGEVNDSIYLIIDGNIAISRKSKAGWFGTLAIVGPKNTLGEENIGETKPSSTTVEAVLGEVTVLKFPSGEFKVLFDKYPELALKFIQQLNEKVDSLQKLIISFG